MLGLFFCLIVIFRLSVKISISFGEFFGWWGMEYLCFGLLYFNIFLIKSKLMKKKRFYSAYAAATALLMGTILTGCSSGETIEGAESTAVDLGLSIKWAAGNVGAENPEDYGLYFAWGETTGYTAEQVKKGKCEFSSSVYKSGSAASISAGLTLGRDAAHANLGGDWRMPTKAEYQELIKNCDVVWAENYNGTGVKGRIFTSKVNGNSVFFPAAGYFTYSTVCSVGSVGGYWAASWDSYYYAWILGFDSGIQNLLSGVRYCGYSVRGVCE